MNRSASQRELDTAAQMLAMLRQQTEVARAELVALREELVRVKAQAIEQPSAQLLVRLVGVALCAQRGDQRAARSPRRGRARRRR